MCINIMSAYVGNSQGSDVIIQFINVLNSSVYQCSGLTEVASLD